MKRSEKGGEKSGKKITERRKKNHESGGSEMKDDRE